ncbi:MAG: right-handed parallel beta-helix repeat-containing protein [Candidatus Zixiibacteriota bacterium]|nr:MAG: right-handed parallel beta-helix repeat-containing protein [candidate division Zixibacteria bacterium]
MKRILTFSVIFVTLACGLGWSTVINIPADYPTIQQGIEASADGDTVLVQPGTYVENLNFNGHNIVLGSLFLPSQDTIFISQTIIDGDTLGSVVTFNHGETPNAIITGFTIQNGFSMNGGGINCSSSNPTIDHNVVSGNTSESDGGGIYCDDSNPLILGNMISGNSVYDGAGGGVYCWNNSSPIISGNTISGNSANNGGGICCAPVSAPVICGNVIRYNSASPGGYGGGIYCLASIPLISNNVIHSNVATSWLLGYGGGICISECGAMISNNTLSLNYARYGGGMAVLDASYPVLNNMILWENTAPVVPQILIDDVSTLAVSYSDIQDTLWPGAGNLSVDPLFRDTAGADFHLMSTACGDSLDSPCIDAGHPAIVDSLLDCSYGLGTYMSDMGAYGGGDSVIVGIDDNDYYLPDKLVLMQNYTNPFNNETKIRFLIVKSMEVRLAVYDLLGREVQTLIDEYRPAGVHTVTFDASDLSSGVYFYGLQVGEAFETKRMVLLK